MHYNKNTMSLYVRDLSIKGLGVATGIGMAMELWALSAAPQWQLTLGSNLQSYRALQHLQDTLSSSALLYMFLHNSAQLDIPLKLNMDGEASEFI